MKGYCKDLPDEATAINPDALRKIKADRIASMEEFIHKAGLNRQQEKETKDGKSAQENSRLSRPESG